MAEARSCLGRSVDHDSVGSMGSQINFLNGGLSLAFRHGQEGDQSSPGLLTADFVGVCDRWKSAFLILISEAREIENRKKLRFQKYSHLESIRCKQKP
jgi:hypothetical protein